MDPIDPVSQEMVNGIAQAYADLDQTGETQYLPSGVGAMDGIYVADLPTEVVTLQTNNKIYLNRQLLAALFCNVKKALRQAGLKMNEQNEKQILAYTAICHQKLSENYPKKN